MGIHVPSSGLTFTPLFEWRLAAQWAHYTWEQFEELEGERQSYIVMAHRLFKQSEAVVAQEQEREARRKARVAKSHKRRR